jgi:hypothetical protein
MVFADISGFTALSERLATRGRIGAEELVETLSRVFGTMLDIAASRCGQLLKFGGDALLFLFDGDDHVTQACSTAVEMRRSLQAASDIVTSVGRLSGAIRYSKPNSCFDAPTSGNEQVLSPLRCATPHGSDVSSPIGATSRPDRFERGQPRSPQSSASARNAHRTGWRWRVSRRRKRRPAASELHWRAPRA